MNRIDRLITEFLDDRDSLSSDELAELVAAVQIDKPLARRLKNQLEVDELISQVLAADRGDFPAQMAQRVLDQDADQTSEITDSADLLLRFEQRKSDAAPQNTQPLSLSEPSVVRRRSWLLKVATVATIAAIVFAAVVPDDSADVPIVQRLGGQVVLIAADKAADDQGNEARLVTVGQTLRPGDRLKTRTASSVVLQYGDGTTVELQMDSSLTLPQQNDEPGRRLRLSAGTLTADVVKQPAGAPMQFLTDTGTATVLGTRLTLQTDDHGTRLDVAEGRVQLADRQTQEAVQVATGQTGTVEQSGVYVFDSGWPGSRRDIVTMFRASDSESLPELRDVAFETFRRIPLEPRGTAGVDSLGRLNFDGGALLADDAAADLLFHMQPLNAFSLEVILRPDNLKQAGPARIIAFSTHSHSTNFSLGQERGQLVLRLQTGPVNSKKAPLELQLCELPDTAPRHVVVTWREGTVQAWLDGVSVATSHNFKGDLTDWQPQHLLFGDDFDGDRIWRGRISGFAIYRRALTPDEVAEHAALATPLLHQLTD
jgi:ferric-dicitrate binding protein FerR (iron transport regulator)